MADKRDRLVAVIDNDPGRLSSIFFFLNDPAPPEIYPLPLHDAFPIFAVDQWEAFGGQVESDLDQLAPAVLLDHTLADRRGQLLAQRPVNRQELAPSIRERVIEQNS